MPWLETLTLTLGGSIAKQILKSWLGDNLPTTLLGDLVDLLKDEGKRVGEQNESKRRIDRIGEQIANSVFPLIETEGYKLHENQRIAVSLELARTLSKAQITSKLLVDCGLDPYTLARNLREINAQATRLFSAIETSVYDRLLVETSKAIIEIATDLVSFQRQFATSVLQSQDQMLERISRLLAIPDEKSQRYESEYLQTIRKSLDRVEMFGVPQYDAVARKQSLTIAYISLDVNLPSIKQVESENAKLTLKSVLKDNKRETSDKQTVRNAPINQLLFQSRRMVIRGYAGSGKTTLMRWIAVRSASRDFPAQLASWNNTIPFLIPLREYVDNDFPETESFVRYTARMLGGKPEDWVHQQLDSGRGIILIDGVDELPSAKRPDMLQRLNELVGAYPFARYVITSRPHALKADLWPEWQEWIATQGFIETVLQPMNNTCTEEFIDHWHAALKIVITDDQERDDLDSNPENLKRLLRRRPALRRLANNPLLCAMICALYRERGKSLPSERIKLYQECVEMLISRREEHRMIGLKNDYPELNYSQQIALIQGFAYWLMHNSYSDVEISEADRYFDSRLPNLSLNSIDGENVRRLFVERASLLSEPVIGRINFAHRTFQEYLAARAAVEAGDFGFLQRNALDDQWQEVIILAAGEARPRERGRFLQALISKADNLKRPKNQRQLYLLALACLETCIDLDSAVRHLVLERAARLFPPKDDDEVKRIADAGEPAVELLGIKPRLQADESRGCVRALGMIGSDSALATLAEYASNERFRSLEYQDIWDNFDRRSYAEKVLKHVPVLRIPKLTTGDGFEYLSEMTELSVMKYSIAHLVPLSSLSNLRELSLYDVQVHDFSPLSNLTKLTRLFLSGTEFPDLSPLSSLINLTVLSLSGSQLPDLSPLASLVNLKNLFLSSSQISDLSPLSSLVNLTVLSLSGSQLPDISQLSLLPNLTDLSLGNVQISDLSNLSSLPNLTSLSLDYTQIQDLSFLVSLPNLTDLSFFHTQVSDFTIRGSLPNLKYLRLFETEISDLSPLSSIPSLTELLMYRCPVSDFTPLLSLPNLESLVLNSTEVSDLSPLASMPSLKKIRWSGAPIPDISSLTQLTDLTLTRVKLKDFTHLSSLSELKKLALYDINVSDLSSLTSISNLTELSLENVPISDLSPLASLLDLENLSLSRTKVSDLSPIVALPKLTQLSINSTKVNDLSPLATVTKPLVLGLDSIQFFDFMLELLRLPNLIGLDLSYANLTNLEPLLNFPCLSKLILGGNWFINLEPLVMLTQLVELDISSTYTTDIKVLSTLLELENLDISYTAVTDITPLADLPKLRKLNIRNCRVNDLSALIHKSGLEIVQ